MKRVFERLMLSRLKRKLNATVMLIPTLAFLFFGGIAAANDDYGNTIGTATEIQPNGSIEGGIYPPGDNDVFRIVFPVKGTLTVFTEGGGCNTYGYLLDSGGNILAEDDDSGTLHSINYDFYISRTLNPGTYYIRVRAESSGGIGPYRLVSRFYEDDHGNSHTEATRVRPNSQTIGAINGAGDSDVFRVDLRRPGTLTIYTTGTTNTYGWLYSVVNDGIRSLANDDDSAGNGNFRIQQTLQAGTYYVQVHHSSSSGTGAYILVSSFKPQRR